MVLRLGLGAARRRRDGTRSASFPLSSTLIRRPKGEKGPVSVREWSMSDDERPAERALESFVQIFYEPGRQHWNGQRHVAADLALDRNPAAVRTAGLYLV